MRPLKGATPAADRTACEGLGGSSTDIAPPIAYPDQQSQCTTLETLLAALDASPLVLRHERYRDSNERGDLAIIGKSGHVYADGTRFLLYVTTDESPRRWGFLKKRLSFCRLTQDGADEGCLHLDRQPTPAEAGLIREAIGIRKRRHLSPDAMAQARVALERARSLDKTPHQPQAFVKSVEG
jgi:hypothetical protein